MKIEIKKDCGCCFDIIEVEDDFEIQQKGNGQIIVDINGVEHMELDTFYGFRILSDN